MRCFLGIGLPAVVRDAVADAVEAARKTKVSVSWVPRENLHITLKFLGEIPPERIRAVESALSATVCSPAPFTLDAAGGGAFPRPANPKVLWIGLREPLELVRELQQNMENALSGAGFPREDRPFHPHITAGRVRGALPPAWGERFVQDLSGRKFGAVPVTAVRLFESRLSPRGATYTVIREFPLGGGTRRRETEEEITR